MLRNFVLLILISVLTAEVQSESCTYRNVAKWESWSNFNPLTNAESNETSAYKVAICTNGMDISFLPSDLEVLYISGNSFIRPNALSAVLANLPNLVAVAIDLCDLRRQDASAMFRNNPTLEYVSITQSSARSDFPPPDMLEHNAELQVLILAGIDIEDLPPRLLSNNIKLEKVDFSQNRLRHIPRPIFSNNMKLQHISLHGNMLVRLPTGVFSGLLQLENLVLSGNELASLSGNLLQENTALANVDFSGNKLTFLPANLFQSSPQLREVIFTNNRIKIIPRGFFNSSADLYVVKFGYNGIPTEGLPNDLLASNPGVFYLDLRGNAGMLPELATRHHGITAELKTMIQQFGYKESDTTNQSGIKHYQLPSKFLQLIIENV